MRAPAVRQFITAYRAHLLFGCCVALFVAGLSSQLPSKLAEYRYGNSYFGADIPRVHDNLTNRKHSSCGDTKHPLMGYAVLPYMLVGKPLGIPPRVAVQFIFVVNAFIWGLLVYGIAYRFSGRHLDSIIHSAFCLSTAATVFWLPVAETFPFSSVSLLLAVVLAGGRWARRESMHVILHLATFAVTVTNWIAALLVTFLRLPWRKGITLTLMALGIVYALSIVQPVFCSRSTPVSVRGALSILHEWKNTQPLTWTLQQIFLEALVPSGLELRTIPAGGRWTPEDLPAVNLPGYRGTLHDAWSMGSPALLGSVYALWLILLAVAVAVSLRRLRGNDSRNVLYGILIVQIVIMLLYSTETFMLTLHTTPLLALSIAPLYRTRLRIPVLVAVLLLTVYAGASNVPTFMHAMDALSGLLS